jgi:outer membrane protein assembly factor BamB
VVADGKAFVTVDPGSHDTRGYGTVLYALDLKTGATVWSRDVPGTYWTSHAVYDGGRLFVMNYDGLVRAYSPADGRVLWENSLYGVYGFTSVPVAGGGRVLYQGAGGNGVNQSVGALAQDDGHQLWAHEGDGGEGMIALDGERLYAPSPCLPTTALDPGSGAVQWRYESGCHGGGEVESSLAGGRLYVVDNWHGHVVLDARSGAKIGDFDARYPPAVAGGVAVYRKAATVWAVDVASGAKLWEYAADGATGPAPLIASGHVFVGSNSGTLAVLDLRSGRSVWSGPAGSPLIETTMGSQAPEPGLGAADGMVLAAASGRLVAWRGSGSAGTASGGSGSPPSAGGPSPGAQAGKLIGRVSSRRRVSRRAARRHGIAVTVALSAPAKVRATMTGRRGRRLGSVARSLSAAGTVRLRVRIARAVRPGPRGERVRLAVNAQQAGGARSTAVRSLVLTR